MPGRITEFWMGHAGDSMTDRYDKIKEDVAFRKLWAEKCGVGFDLSPFVPNVPKIEPDLTIEKAA